MGLVQYLKETRSEMNHVAWPTRIQTIIYTILVIALSILVSLYLGLFDFIFTTGLSRAVEFFPKDQGLQIQENLPTPTSTTSLKLDDTPPNQ